MDLADRLLPSFDSESGVPYSDVNLFTRKAHAPKWSPDSSTSEVTTIQLEFRDLSRATGNLKYEVMLNFSISFIITVVQFCRMLSLRCHSTYII